MASYELMKREWGDDQLDIHVAGMAPTRMSPVVAMFIGVLLVVVPANVLLVARSRFVRLRVAHESGRKPYRHGISSRTGSR